MALTLSARARGHLFRCCYLVRRFHGRLVVNRNCHPRTFARRAFNVEFRLCIFLQGLRNQRAEFAWHGPRCSVGETDSVVGHDDMIIVLPFVQALDGKCAGSPTVESIFERVGQDFVDEQPHRHRDIHGDRRVTDFEIESDKLHSRWITIL
jgi:hypothetical protein